MALARPPGALMTWSVNPLFVPAPPFNFHLQAGSPAVGTGTSTLAPKYDFDGNLSSTTKVDRGAY